MQLKRRPPISSGCQSSHFLNETFSGRERDERGEREMREFVYPLAKLDSRDEREMAARARLLGSGHDRKSKYL